jgi:hypothetical protein
VSPAFGGNKPILQITPAFVREAYSLLRQSIIHVEQDDIDIDEDETEIARENVQPKMSEDDSQDVTMSGGGDTEMTEQTYAEPSGTDGSTSTQAQGLVTPKTPQNDGPTTSSKRRMVITHDKYMTLQSLIVLHLAAVERETGKGIDRDELIDWYLEMKEEDIQDVDELEYEKELITKVLKKLVKVRCLYHYGLRSGECSHPSADRTIILSRSQVMYKTRYLRLWTKVAHKAEMCGCSIWSTRVWMPILRLKLLSHLSCCFVACVRFL